MQQPAINLYTSRPSDGGFRSLSELLSQQRPVNLCDLSDLPAPIIGQSRRQKQLRTERAELKNILEVVLTHIQYTENHSDPFSEKLIGLRQDRDRYELRIEEIDRLLGTSEEGGIAA